MALDRLPARRAKVEPEAAPLFALHCPLTGVQRVPDPSATLAASILMTSALRGQSLRSSRHIRAASRSLSKSFRRLRSVDHRLSLPSYQPVIFASVLDRSVMAYIYS